MKLSEKITLEIFKDKKFKESLNGEFEYLESSLTHYIHNDRNEVSSFYKEGAENAIEKLLLFQHGTVNPSKSIIDNTLIQLKKNTPKIPFPTPLNSTYTFIDLFAGIGGFRLALQELGGKCVYTSEWDKYSQHTYRTNFGELPFGDITRAKTKSFIPDNFDVLCAGFPCQAFSIAGKRGGFEDTRGTLFFEVAKIIRDKRPQAIFLENVKGLRNHDGGKTLATILHTIREDLNYFVPDPIIVNAKNHGVPQNRERIFIVGFIDEDAYKNFQYPKENADTSTVVNDILEESEVSVKYYLSETYLETLRRHRRRHEGKGNGFGFQIIPNDGVANAVVCGGMGRERNLLIDDRLTNFVPVTKITGEVNREGIRKMTPREWARLQGFPDEFIIPVSDGQAYKQFGNSVAVPAIRATAENILKALQIRPNE